MPSQLPNFNPSAVQPLATLAPVADGWYKCAITSSDTKPNSAGTGSYIEIQDTIMEGEFTGRKFFIVLNTINPSQQAVEMAYGELSAICRACGFTQPLANTAPLHGVPHYVRVSTRPAGVGRDGKSYSARNEVEEYAHLSGTPLSQIQEGGVPGAVPAWAAGQGAANGQAGAPTMAAPVPAPAAIPYTGARVMTPLAGQYTYEQYIAQGWTDATLIAGGLMQAPVAAPPPPAAAPPPPPFPTMAPPAPAAPAVAWRPPAAPVAAPPGPPAPTPAAPAPGGGQKPPWLP